MSKPVIEIILQDNYNANDPIVVAVREEMIRRLVERNEDFKIDWLAENEQVSDDPRRD